MWGKETQMFHFLAAFSSSGTYVFLIFLPSILKGGSRSSTGNGHHGFSWAVAPAPSVTTSAVSANHVTSVRCALIRVLLTCGLRLAASRTTSSKYELSATVVVIHGGHPTVGLSERVDPGRWSRHNSARRRSRKGTARLGSVVTAVATRGAGQPTSAA